MQRLFLEHDKIIIKSIVNKDRHCASTSRLRHYLVINQNYTICSTFNCFYLL